MLEALGLDPAIDFATLEWLGNTGSVALPMTLAIGLESGIVKPGDQVGLLGIGSGINCLMLAAQWQRAMVGSAAGFPFVAWRSLASGGSTSDRRRRLIGGRWAGGQRDRDARRSR